MNVHSLTGQVKQTYIQMTNMMNAAVLMGMDSCPIEGFDKDKVEAYLEEKAFLDTSEFGDYLLCVLLVIETKRLNQKFVGIQKVFTK